MNESIVKDIKQLVDENYYSLIDGNYFSSKPLFRVMDNCVTEELKVNTLTGLCDFIRVNIDSFKKKDFIILIESYKKVSLISKIKKGGTVRNRPLTAYMNEGVQSFKYGNFIENEDFIIKLKSLFLETKDQSSLLNYVSRLTVNNSIELKDDGVTQSATVKKGTSGALKELETAPSIITLKPFRTFREVEQPASEFLFRLKTFTDRVPSCALFESDGGSWEIDAVQNIKSYLEKKITDIQIIA